MASSARQAGPSVELDSDCDHEEEDEALLGSGAPGQQSNHRLLGELPAVVNMLNTIGRSNSWILPLPPGQRKLLRKFSRRLLLHFRYLHLVFYYNKALPVRDFMAAKSNLACLHTVSRDLESLASTAGWKKFGKMLITGHATSAAAFVASDAISGFVQDIFTLMLRGTGPPIALLLHFLNWPRAHGKAEVWRLTRTLSVVPLTRAILEADVWTEELANARTVIIEEWQKIRAVLKMLSPVLGGSPRRRKRFLTRILRLRNSIDSISAPSLTAPSSPTPSHLDSNVPVARVSIPNTPFFNAGAMPMGAGGSGGLGGTV